MVMRGASGSWNVELVHASFFQEEVDVILSIPPSQRQDALCWYFDKFSRFIVTSAYWLATQNLQSANSPSLQVCLAFNHPSEAMKFELFCTNILHLEPRFDKLAFLNTKCTPRN
ncbi:hypothetical protein ACOSQ3_005239 [Xanthoceras sorbifolium]